MREMFCGYGGWRILYYEIGDYAIKKRKLQWFCWIIINEESDNFSGGRSPHWVNHVNLCLYCIVYLLCFVSAFVLFYCSTVLFF